MLSTSLIDGAAHRVGGLVSIAFVHVLEDRLVCLAAHGSAVMAGMTGTGTGPGGWCTAEATRPGFVTDVKPATRALLVELGEPVFEVWRADY